MAQHPEGNDVPKQAAPSLNDRQSETANNGDAHDTNGVVITNTDASGSPGVDAAAQSDLAPDEESVPADQKSQIQLAATARGLSTNQDIAGGLDVDALPKEHVEKVVTGQSAADGSSKRAVLEGLLDGSTSNTTQGLQPDVDQRLEKLEKIFDTLAIVRFTDDNASETSSEDEDPIASDKRVLPIPKANFMTVQEYEKRNSDPKFSLGEPHYALDVIYTGPKSKDLGVTSVSVENDEHKTPDFAHDKSQIRFIQINSIALRDAFSQVGDSKPETPVNPTLIFSPFKPLCYGSELLQAQLDHLIESMERSSPTTTTTTTQEVSKVAETGESELPDEEAQKKAAINDLKCLMDFYKTYIEPSWLHLRGTSVESVRFADLSSLFQPGDEVFEPGSSQRFWKVIKITGGRPTIQNLFEGEDISGDSPNDREQANISAEGPAPGSTQLARKKELPERMSASRETAAKDVADNWTTFHIDGYYIDYDGSKFGPVPKQISIDFFSGTVNLMDLAVRPLRSASDAEMRLQRINEGRRLVRCCEDRTKLYYYASSTLSESPSGKPLQQSWRANNTDFDPFSRSNMRNIRPSKIEERVVVDFSMTFQEYNPDWAPEFGLGSYTRSDGREVGFGPDQGWDQWDLIMDRFFTTPALKSISRQFLDWYDKKKSDDFKKQDDWLKESIGRNSKPDRSPLDDETLLLPDRVFGFVLRTRTWTCFSIEHLREIDDDRTQGWDELQIPKQHKVTLISLFDHHRKRAEIPRPGKWDFDFIEGKGNGLVVLLHGVPGVGKTSTAESLASKYKRPLLPITCGNLGVDADGVERALTENFELAEAWDAIVLLDEADVFLARRRTEDLQRNALVSIFLRTLEYYNGILFLTTNRTGDFDDAFRSRIHTSLFYDDLDEASSKAIWQSNLARLDRQLKKMGQPFEVENGGTEILEYAVRHFQCLHRNKRQAWNGRQIRNAFHTAVALAEYEGKMDEKTPVLRWQHFKSTANASEKFESYLRITHGSSERDLASQEKLRASIDPHTGNFHFPRNQQNLKDELSRFRTELEDITPFSQRDTTTDLNHVQAQSGLPTPLTYAQATTPSMPASTPHNWPQAPAPFGYPPNVQQQQQQQPPYYHYGNPGYPQQGTQPSQSGPPPMPYGQPPMGYPMAGYGQGQYPQQAAYGQPPMPNPPSAPAETAGQTAA